MSARRGVWRWLAGAVLALCGLLSACRVPVIWLAPYDADARLAAQLRHLAAVDQAAALRMQQAFPEGEFFTRVLTGLAAGELARATTDPAERRDRLDVVEASLAAVDTDQVRDRFGSIPELTGGIFYRGWTLALESYLVTVDDGTDRRDRYLAPAARDAADILRAVASSASGFVASYPGQYWPCDTVVALGAVARLHDVAGALAFDPQAWIQRVAASRDPGTGLLAHQVSADGHVLAASRGSSQAIIQTFWPYLTDSRADWSRFTELFVTREAGLVGIREHAKGTQGSGDVDSGPLVLGISLSASAVGLAAARANGDADLADALDREAELLGAPWQWGHARSYAFGVLPVGDAFLAWARSVPLATPTPSTSPRPLWALWSLPGLVLLGLGLVIWRRGSPTRRRSPH